MANVVMAYIGMAAAQRCTLSCAAYGTAYVVMAYVGMAAAQRCALSCAAYTYGLCSYGLYIYGRRPALCPFLRSIDACIHGHVYLDMDLYHAYRRMH